jgi:hypothetical protein
MKKTILTITALATLAFFIGCKKEDDSCKTTYKDVKEMINTSCAYAGCHAGAEAGLYVPEAAKDYTTYSGLKAGLENGKFDDRALTRKDMPPPAFVTEGHPKELSQEEIDLLTCWSDNGHAEN